MLRPMRASRKLVTLLFLCVTSLPINGMSRNKSRAVINIRLPASMAYDRVEMYIWQKAIASSLVTNLPPQKMQSMLTNRAAVCRFYIDGIDKPWYVTVFRKESGLGRPFVEYYLLEPGDPVTIRVDTLTLRGEYRR